MPVTSLLSWRFLDGAGLEGTRVLLGSGAGFRALGRMVRTGEAPVPFTASYRLILREDGSAARISVTSATAARERHLTINRTDDGFWLLDTGAGGTRAAFDGAVDVDLAYSPIFNAPPVRRLRLHRDAGEHALAVVFVTLPELEVRLVEQRYRTVRTLDESGTAVVEFRWGDLVREVVVDGDGIAVSYAQLAERV